MAATRRFSFWGAADLVQRHDRALAELERLRDERPELAEKVHSDFDARLAAAQQSGLRSSSAGVRATLSALVGAVEQALVDEQALAHEPVAEREPSRSDEADRIASEAAGDAMATSI